MRLIYVGILIACASLGFADTITLKNGTVIHGTYLGGTARSVRVDDGNSVQTLDIFDVSKIEFGSNGGAVRNPRPIERNVDRNVDRSNSNDDRPVLRRSESNVMRPDDTPPPPPPPAPANFELPAGTNLTIRMIEGVDSQTNRVGQTFRASLDQPVMVDGNAVIPRGADVTVKLVDQKESGKLTGRADLTLQLQSIYVNGRMVDINTQSVKQESASRGERTAKVAGGTAAVGAIIGAIAGGGKGAAIGAGAGAAAGAGAEVVTAGQRVRIPSETRLTFVLDSAVRF
uniref:DUF5666 domain-containing protein n=1 Tax=Solibacter usitatus (strain Ellin6076) TaxID=234267 RepID=Q023Y6_SOLUE